MVREVDKPDRLLVGDGNLSVLNLDEGLQMVKLRADEVLLADFRILGEDKETAVIDLWEADDVLVGARRLATGRS